MNGIYITSTGTGIGKTYLTQRLLMFDKARRDQFVASKPVISGWPTVDEDIQHTDTGILLQAQQLALTPQNIHRFSPWRLTHPLTPSMAAAKEGKKIALDALVSHCQALFLQAKQKNKNHLIEGVGGVMAPLGENYTVVDWIYALACPCLLVVGSYLGTLSHTLTAVSVLQMKGINILGIVVNETPDSSVALSDTYDCLAQLLPAIPLFTFPFANESQQENAGLEKLYLHIVNNSLQGCKARSEAAIFS